MHIQGDADSLHFLTRASWVTVSPVLHQGSSSSISSAKSARLFQCVHCSMHPVGRMSDGSIRILISFALCGQQGSRDRGGVGGVLHPPNSSSAGKFQVNFA